MLESDAASNVKHVEAIFSPNDHVRRNLDYGKMLDAVNKASRGRRGSLVYHCTIRLDSFATTGLKPL